MHNVHDEKRGVDVSYEKAIPAKDAPLFALIYVRAGTLLTSRNPSFTRVLANRTKKNGPSETRILSFWRGSLRKEGYPSLEHLYWERFHLYDRSFPLCS